MSARANPWRGGALLVLSACGADAEPGPGEDPGARADASTAETRDDAGPGCEPSGPELCGNGIDDDCDPASLDACPQSCAAIAAADPSAPDGDYRIAPAGLAFEAYCDMTTDGGGWTLAINAPAGGYDAMPIATEPLAPDVHGRVDDARLAALLSRPADERNNLRIQLRDPDLTVSMRFVMEAPGPAGPDDPAPADVTPQAARVPWDANGPCEGYDEGPDEPVAQGPSEAWSFTNGSHATEGSGASSGNTGFTDRVSRDAYVGFWGNWDTGPDLSCGRSYSREAWYPARAGALWVR